MLGNTLEFRSKKSLTMFFVLSTTQPSVTRESKFNGICLTRSVNGLMSIHDVTTLTISSAPNRSRMGRTTFCPARITRVTLTVAASSTADLATACHLVPCGQRSKRVISTKWASAMVMAA